MKIYILSLLILATTCNGQKNNNVDQTTKTKMETTEIFDIDTFNKNQKKGIYNYLLGDSTRIEQQVDGDFFNVKIYPKLPNLLIIEKVFYKTGNLKSELIHYPESFFKSLKKYNEVGKLIEDINYDIPFKFSFKDILKLIEEEKDTINLFDKNTSITRGSSEHGTLWKIRYKKSIGRKEFIIVDGITGKVLERNYYYLEEN